MSPYGPGPPSVGYPGVDAARGGNLALPYASALEFTEGELEAALQLDDRQGARPLPPGVSLGGERTNSGFGGNSRVVGGTWVHSGGGGVGSSGGGNVGGIRDEKGGYGGSFGRENRDGSIGPLPHRAYSGIGHHASSGVPASGLTYLVGAHYSPSEPLSSHLQHGPVFPLAAGQGPTDRPGAVLSRLTPFSGGVQLPLSRPQQDSSPVVLNGRGDAWGRHPVGSSAAPAPPPVTAPPSSTMGTSGTWNPTSAARMAYVTPPRRVVAANQSVPPPMNGATTVSPQAMRRRAAPIAPSPSPPSASSGAPPSSPGQATPSSRTGSDPPTSPKQVSPRLGVAEGRCGGGGAPAAGSGALSLQQERRLKNRMSAERYVRG